MQSHNAAVPGTRSVSDDDLCSDCAHCHYQPGELSGCAQGFPGGEDQDGYVMNCPVFLQRDESKNSSTCDDCGTVVESIIGCPGGAEVCSSCFDNGHH